MYMYVWPQLDTGLICISIIIMFIYVFQYPDMTSEYQITAVVDM